MLSYIPHKNDNRQKCFSPEFDDKMCLWGDESLVAWVFLLSLPLLEGNAILDGGTFLTGTGLPLGKPCPCALSVLDKETCMI